MDELTVKFSRSDALYVYSWIDKHLDIPDHNVEEFLDRLENFLTSDLLDDEDDSEISLDGERIVCVDDRKLKNEKLEEVDVVDLQELPPLRAFNSTIENTAKRVCFNGLGDLVDATNCYSLLPKVASVFRTPKTIAFTSELPGTEPDIVFYVKRFPKEWTKLFALDTEFTVVR